MSPTPTSVPTPAARGARSDHPDDRDDRISVRRASRPLFGISVSGFYRRYGDPFDRGLSPAYAELFDYREDDRSGKTLSRARARAFLAAQAGQVAERGLPASPTARRFRRDPIPFRSVVRPGSPSEPGEPGTETPIDTSDTGAHPLQGELDL